MISRFVEYVLERLLGVMFIFGLLFLFCIPMVCVVLFAVWSARVLDLAGVSWWVWFLFCTGLTGLWYASFIDDVYHER